MCQKIFKSHSNYKRHTKKHDPDHIETVDKCEKCLKLFSSPYAYKKHLKRHEAPAWICDICGKALKSNNGLLKHKRVHSGVRRYVCHVCGKAFQARVDYKCMFEFIPRKNRISVIYAVNFIHSAAV